MAPESMNVTIRLSEKKGQIRCDRIALSDALRWSKSKRDALVVAADALLKFIKEGTA